MSARDCSSTDANSATASGPEMGPRGGEFLFGGAHGVVDLDQRGAGPVGEVGGRDVRELVRRNVLGRGARRLGSLATPAAQDVDARTDHGGPAEHREADPRPAPAAGAQPVGHRDRRAGPGLRGQPRLDVLGADLVHPGLADREAGGHRDAVGAVTDGDGEQRVLLAQLGAVCGLVGPFLPADTVERVDEDDEEVHAVLGLQPLHRRLDLRHLGGFERAGAVGHVVVEAQGWFGRGNAGTQHEHHEYPDQYGQPAHGDLRDRHGAIICASVNRPVHQRRIGHRRVRVGRARWDGGRRRSPPDPRHPQPRSPAAAAPLRAHAVRGEHGHADPQRARAEPVGRAARGDHQADPAQLRRDHRDHRRHRAPAVDPAAPAARHRHGGQRGRDRGRRRRRARCCCPPRTRSPRGSRSWWAGSS